MTDRDRGPHDEAHARAVAELLDQVARRNRRLRSVESERDRLERRLAAQQAAWRAAQRASVEALHRVEGRLAHVQQAVGTRLTHLEQSVEARLAHLEQGIDALRREQAERTVRSTLRRAARKALRRVGLSPPATVTTRTGEGPSEVGARIDEALTAGDSGGRHAAPPTGEGAPAELVAGTSIEEAAAPARVSEPGFRGFLDAADCRRIAGWVWDASQADRRLTVEVTDGKTPVATVVADRHRPDLEAAGIGDGRYSFALSTPSSLKDGQPHVISARVADSEFTLEGTPRRMLCQPEPDDLLVGSRSLTPASRRWGVERGTPVDRRYIEAFLGRHREDIRGRVLEIGDDTYTRRFGGDRITRSDVLNVLEGNPATTIVADLADGREIPSDTFDAAIVTQTMQLIYDLRAAIRTLHRILKPGGVVLVTVPGITPMGDIDWGDQWCWSFTERSIGLLFGEVFRDENIAVESHGNVLAAASFLYGLTAEDLTWEELDVHDPAYPVTITVRAVKEAEEITPRARTPASAVTRPAAVLLYHRVADVPSDPWSLSVRPDRFLEQMDALRDEARIVPLSDLPRAAGRTGRLPAVAVTFDDGYADNLVARSGLREHDLPATFFVISGALGRELWWDQLERLLLRPGLLPARVRLWVDGIPHSWPLGDAAAYSEEDHARHIGWRAVNGGDPTPRHALYRSLHALLQGMPEEERGWAMAQVREWLQSPPEEGATRALSPEELAALASEAGIEIGAHSVSHPALPAVPAAEKRREIRGSKRQLEELLGRPVGLLSYPFGAADQETAAIVHQAGFDAAWTAAGRPIARGADPLRLGRFIVGDWSGAELARRLADWTAD